MSRDNTDQIIAHVDFLRSIDRLLKEAESVRAKRQTLEQLLAEQAHRQPAPPRERKAGVSHA